MAHGCRSAAPAGLTAAEAGGGRGAAAVRLCGTRHGQLTSQMSPPPLKFKRQAPPCWSVVLDSTAITTAKMACGEAEKRGRTSRGGGKAPEMRRRHLVDCRGEAAAPRPARALV